MGKHGPKIKVRLASDAVRAPVRHCLPPHAVDSHFFATRREQHGVRLEPRCQPKEAAPKEGTPLDGHPRSKLPSISFAWLLSAALLLYITLDKLSCLGAQHPGAAAQGGHLSAAACACPCTPSTSAPLEEADSPGGAGPPEPANELSTEAPDSPRAEEAAATPEAGRRLQQEGGEGDGDGAGAAKETAAGEATDSGGEEHEDPEDALPFLFTAIGVGTALAHLSTFSRFQWLQQTVMLFLLGMFYSILVDLCNLEKVTHGFLGVSHHMWMKIDPHLLLAVMLPILITGDSISIDTSVAKHVATQCAYLAGPGVVICSVALALFFWLYIPYDWPFMLCLTMSSILAATDPVAVVSLLKELGASPALTVQIQGESLLNDGTAMVLFTVAYDILKGEVYSFGDIIIFLVKSAVVAVLLGLAIGCICTAWIRMASNRLDSRNNLIQISITLCCSYWSWILAEGTFHVSGVLCTVSSALVLAHCMWPHIVSKEAMHHVWHTFEHIGNSTIFFVAGSLTGHNMVSIPFMDYVHLLVIYVVCTFVRGSMLFASVPILNEVKHSCTEPVTMADATVMCWGGLRGALGLALAIKVNVDCADSRIHPMDGERVLFYVGGVALLTLLVNATTCPVLVKWLRLNRPSGTKQMMMLNIHRHMSDFASEQAAGGNAINNHIVKMLGEVERAINKDVDTAMAQKCAGPDHFRAEGSRNSAHTRHSCSSSQGALIDSELHELINIEPGKMCRCCCRRVQARKPSVPTAGYLAKRLLASHQRLKKIDHEQQGLLGISPLHLADSEMEQIRSVLLNDGDWVTPLQLKPVNDVFLSLVRAKYWTSIEADEFISCEGHCLLDSISGALGVSGYKLMDLHHIRRHLLRTFGEEDHEVKRAVLMQWDMSQKDSVRERSIYTSDASDDGDEQHPPKGCMYIISSVWYNAILILVIAVAAGIGISICLFSNPEIYQPPVTGEMATVHGCFVIFILDFAFRLCAMKGETFHCNWRRLDAFLTVVCLVGSVLEILYTAGVIGDHILGSPLDEAVRALMVLQLLRVHQLCKSVHTIRTLRRMATVATGSAPKHLAGRLQVITILTAMARAHIQSQEELIKYFGTQGKVGSGAVARCISESCIEVCDASYIAWCIGTTVSPAILSSLRTLRSCIIVTEDLCKLVEDAHQCGAMSEQDADSLLQPMKSHQYDLRDMVHTTHEGVVPRDLCTLVSVGAEEHKPSASSKWASCVGESCPEGCHGLVSGCAPVAKKDAPRSFAEAGVQTDGGSEAAPEVAPEAETPPLQPARARSKQVEDNVSEIPGDKDTCIVADSVLRRCDYDMDPSQCEGWSVYTVDDLEPPQKMPGPGCAVIGQDSTRGDVRL